MNIFYKIIIIVIFYSLDTWKLIKIYIRPIWQNTLFYLINFTRRNNIPNLKHWYDIVYTPSHHIKPLFGIFIHTHIKFSQHVILHILTFFIIGSIITQKLLGLESWNSACIPPMMGLSCVGNITILD